MDCTFVIKTHTGWYYKNGINGQVQVSTPQQATNYKSSAIACQRASDLVNNKTHLIRSVVVMKRYESPNGHMNEIPLKVITKH